MVDVTVPLQPGTHDGAACEHIGARAVGGAREVGAGAVVVGGAVGRDEGAVEAGQAGTPAGHVDAR